MSWRSFRMVSQLLCGNRLSEIFAAVVMVSEARGEGVVLGESGDV